VESAYGKHTFPLEKVAAIVGHASRAAMPQVFLRDGQILHGAVHCEDLQFNSSAGPPMKLDAQVMDRLVLREKNEDGQPSPQVCLFLETLDEDRIAVTHETRGEISVTTPWGSTSVPLTEIEWLQAMREDLPGFRIALRDGSRFFAFLDNKALSVKTQDFGECVFQPNQVSGLVAALTPAEKEDAPKDLAVPYLTLAGGNLIVGRLEPAQIDFIAMGGVIPRTTSQLRSMRNIAEEEGGDLLGGVQFEAEFWNGAVITGQLRQTVLPIRAGDWVARVPVRDILELQCPTPRVTPETQDRIAKLIRELGHPSWEKREAASRELAELGLMAAPQLKEAATQSKDPEVRRRTKKLLEGIEQ